MTARTPSTLSHKIGQMIMMGFQGTSPQDQEVKQLTHALSQGHVGGVILFAYNIESPTQIRALNQCLQASPSGIPVLIATDQEGGRVERLPSSKGFRGFLPPEVVCREKTCEQAEQHYEEMAKELLEAGFNLNLAPGVDLYSTQSPVIGGLLRSYSHDPDLVTAYARAFIQAHHQSNVLTCIKHYPGHGFAEKDSHQGMVDITLTHLKRERAPFQNLIRSDHVDMVMMAHLVHKKVDPQFPSSLSKAMLTTWLREEDDFSGVVITDDLMMGAIAQNFEWEEVVLQAILAGNDILLFSNNTASNPNEMNSRTKEGKILPTHIISVVEQAIASGKLSRAHIEESHSRIMKLKSRLTRKGSL